MPFLQRLTLTPIPVCAIRDFFNQILLIGDLGRLLHQNLSLPDRGVVNQAAIKRHRSLARLGRLFHGNQDAPGP